MTIEQDNADSLRRSAVAAEALVTELRAEHADLLDLWRAEIDAVASREQRLFMQIFQSCLQIRLGPAVIGSTTSDAVIDDMVRDAARMATLAWSLVSTQMLALAGEPSPP